MSISHEDVDGDTFDSVGCHFIYHTIQWYHSYINLINLIILINTYILLKLLLSMNETITQMGDDLSIEEQEFLIRKLIDSGEFSVMKVGEGSRYGMAVSLVSRGYLRYGSQNIPSPYHARFRFSREGRKIANRISKEVLNY